MDKFYEGLRVRCIVYAGTAPIVGKTGRVRRRITDGRAVQFVEVDFDGGPYHYLMRPSELESLVRRG